jgi:hypothetical protein
MLHDRVHVKNTCNVRRRTNGEFLNEGALGPEDATCITRLESRVLTFVDATDIACHTTIRQAHDFGCMQ